MTDDDRWAITNVRAVAEGRIIDGATVVMADGRITDVAGSGPPPSGALDGSGLLLMPGLVDSHCDGLEKEISPRRTATFPIDYALVSFEGKLRAAGVTTVFHGLPYQNRPSIGRTIDGARRVQAALGARCAEVSATVDHRVLYRFEARDEVALDPLLDDLDLSGPKSGHNGDDGAKDPDDGATRATGDAIVAVPADATPLISYEDHTPGQGQYRDPAQYAAAVDPANLPPGVTAEEWVVKRMAEADEVFHVRSKNLDRLAPLAGRGEIRLLAHDLEGPGDVEWAIEAGATVAEFPVTKESAQAARRHDMAVVMGAPNALRGGSHNANASARELVALGLCDVLASDYLPSALLSAAFVLVAEGLCSLPRAIALITSGPARLAGLGDRGRLAPGARADLVLVDDSGRWPQVVATWRADDAARHRRVR